MCEGRSPPASSGAYLPRDAVGTVLYKVVAGSLETFLAAAHARERIVPRFVEREFREYLACGVAVHGFLRVHCDSCGYDRIVPFSCCPDKDTMKSSGP